MNVTELVARARKAQRALEDLDQEQVDDIVTAVAWVGVKNAEALAKLAVEETGLGNVADKMKKNRRKTMGTLRDLRGARSVGVIKDDPATGITEIAKPVGVNRCRAVQLFGDWVACIRSRRGSIGKAGMGGS